MGSAPGGDSDEAITVSDRSGLSEVELANPMTVVTIGVGGMCGTIGAPRQSSRPRQRKEDENGSSSGSVATLKWNSITAVTAKMPDVAVRARTEDGSRFRREGM